MALIKASRVTVEFPIYGASSRLAAVSLAKFATGGILLRDEHRHVVVRALDEVSFEFHEGERIGLVGHNGSGKSTLLRVLAGILEPIKGKMIVEGRITSMLGIMVGIDFEATGLENITMRSRLMGVSGRKLRPILRDIIEFAGIGEYIHLPMRTYSAGMIMRLAFAVATSVDADIILMDEWLSVGDAAFIEKAKSRLDFLVKRARIVVIASHDLGLIESQCNRVLKLEHGRIEEISTELLRQEL
jgi:lipopolysaccharide transport system ATP-binding protein